MLEIPASSLRRYAQTFADRLSPSAHKRKRSYTDEDLSTLRKIRAYIGQGLSADDIRDRLDVVEAAAAQDSALALLPTVLQHFENIAQTLSSQQAEIDDLRKQIGALNRPWWRRLLG